jgi:O-antigen/teichoic acid export membrane protein
VIGPASIRRSFFSSLRSHAVARVTQAAIALVLVPYVLSHLSRAEYGLWSWLLAMAAWLTVVDLGLSLGNVNPLARGLAEGEHRRVGQILVAALAFQGSIVLAIVVVVITAREPLLAALPPAGRAIGVLALLPLVVAQGLVVLSFPFGALLSALQRLDLVHKIQTVLLVTQALATIVILESGGRVVALAWLQCVLGGSQLVARALLCRRLYPALRPARPERGDLPRLLGMGVPVAVLGFVGGIALNFERTFLGFVVDLALLAQYAGRGLDQLDAGPLGRSPEESLGVHGCRRGRRHDLGDPTRRGRDHPLRCRPARVLGGVSQSARMSVIAGRCERWCSWPSSPARRAIRFPARRSSSSTASSSPRPPRSWS